LVETLAPHGDAATIFSGLLTPYQGQYSALTDSIFQLIKRLGNSSGDRFVYEAAASELRHLKTRLAGSAWCTDLEQALHDTTRAWRSSFFTHASVASAANTLSNHAPGNALDLSALIRQHLNDLQKRLQGDESNGLQKFWGDPVNGENRKPHVENTCRDRLLEMLQPAMAGQNVTLEKEAAHANDTRADLRAATMVAGVKKVVPIEIKPTYNPKVWTAWRDQLDHRYTTHPAAEGVGIYLVLWFGSPKVDVGESIKPTSAADFQQQLAEKIPTQDRARLQVVVLDLSLPRSSKATA
jgi:hypothetical protein